MTRLRAFTMLELVISIVLVGVISGIAIAGFSAVTSRTKEVAATAQLDAVTAAQSRFAYAYGRYTPLPSDLTELGPDVVVVAATSPATFATDEQVSLAVGVSGTLAIAAMTDEGECVTRQRPPYGTQGSGIDSTLPDNAFCDPRAALPLGEAAAPVVSAAW